MTDRATMRVADIDEAIERAVDLGELGPPSGPNPRVGCVILAAPDAASAHDAPRVVLGAGYHRGAGTPHAEVAAIADARARGADVRGATAVVTLEPCAHTGRTPPCVNALIAAEVGEVVFAVPDPDPVASGGGDKLAAHGIAVRHRPNRRATQLTAEWAVSAARGTPFVTLKLATSLDGRVAAADGTSQWITSAASRRHAHDMRARIDAIAVGTGTALADDPALTARDDEGGLLAQQPLRVVVGHREPGPEARVRGAGGELVRIRSHDVADVLAELGARDVRHLLVEGGPTLATAFLRAGAVDQLHVYTAPLLLGAGANVIADLGVTTLADGLRWRTTHVERLGDDVFVAARKEHP